MSAVRCAVMLTIQQSSPSLDYVSNHAQQRNSNASSAAAAAAASVMKRSASTTSLSSAGKPEPSDLKNCPSFFRILFLLFDTSF